jgi:hypothetical protein
MQTPLHIITCEHTNISYGHCLVSYTVQIYTQGDIHNICRCCEWKPQKVTVSFGPLNVLSYPYTVHQYSTQRSLGEQRVDGGRARDQLAPLVEVHVEALGAGQLLAVLFPGGGRRGERQGKGLAFILEMSLQPGVQ